MEISEELKIFINENIKLINENTKESWETIYKKIYYEITGKFTETILSAGINDPAKLMGYIPRNYLRESNIQRYIISNTVISIGNYAFEYCDNLTSVVIPDSVTRIGDYAFYGCSRLTGVVIPNSITNIGECTFFSCNSLTSIEIPNNVMSVERYAFSDCSNLTSLTISNSIISIGEYAFSSCDNLKEIQFDGTKKEAIQCGIGDRSKKKWREDSAIKKIICTDGEIKLN